MNGIDMHDFEGMYAELESCLTRIGYDLSSLDDVLRPGDHRAALVAFLAGRLFERSPVELLAAATITSEGYSDLSEEEKIAAKWSHLFQLTGIQTSPEAVRGTDTPLNNVQLLRRLAFGCEALGATPPCQGADCMVDSRIIGVLDYACERIPEVCSTQVQLFPDDVLAILPTDLQSTLQEKLAEMKSQISHVQDLRTNNDAQEETSASSCSTCASASRAVQDYLVQLKAVMRLSQTELGAWTKTTAGLKLTDIGSSSKQFAHLYTKVCCVLRSCEQLQSLHDPRNSWEVPLGDVVRALNLVTGEAEEVLNALAVLSTAA